MTPYKSRSGKESGVEAYEIHTDSIIVKFKIEEECYLYSHGSAGKDKIEEMKSCAAKGKGLSTFISQNKPKYEKKFLYKYSLEMAR